MTLKKLNKSQERILAYLKERAQDGLPPSVREICNATALNLPLPYMPT